VSVISGLPLQLDIPASGSWQDLFEGGDIGTQPADFTARGPPRGKVGRVLSVESGRDPGAWARAGSSQQQELQPTAN
jgi:hypothetical protein